MSVIDAFDYKDLKAQRVGRFDFGINTTFTIYRLKDTIIDTGPSNQWRYIKWFVKNKPFNQLLLTHYHEDHSGNAGAIYKLTGVQPRASKLTAKILKKGFHVPIAQRIIWGRGRLAEVAELPEDLFIAGEKAIPIFTPGHSRDMTCYLMPDRGWIFSADLYIATRLKLMRRDERVSALLESIRKVLTYDFDVLLCPHRGVVEGGKKRLQNKYDYLVELTSAAQTLKSQGLPVREITRRLLGREHILGLLPDRGLSKLNLISSCIAVDLAKYPS